MFLSYGYFSLSLSPSSSKINKNIFLESTTHVMHMRTSYSRVYTSSQILGHRVVKLPFVMPDWYSRDCTNLPSPR